MRENVERTSNAEQELETFSVLLYEILEYLLVKNQLLIYFFQFTKFLVSSDFI